ncbi:MAG TPA: DUF2269 family protein [Candidatus Limnocylindrales bacterium]|nr:DUF2269 family protein [Candidatus Limnocylindrales bacterium]
MTPIVAILLFLHVLGAIAVFGPTFAFPLIGSMGGKEPMHANFATRLSLAIEEKITLPGAIVQLITGLGLIVFVPYNLLSTHWLLLAIAVYAVAITFAYFVQAKSVEHVIELTNMPPGMVPSEGPGAAPAGPPPHVAAAVKRVQRGGMFLTAMIVAIVFLMVVKPTF